MFHTPFCLPYQPKSRLRAPKPSAASGACLVRRVWVYGVVSTLTHRLRRPHPSFRDMFKSFRGVRDASMSATCRHRPIMAARHTLIWAKNAVAQHRILYETAEIQTTTTVEGVAHPFETCKKRFEVVCNVSHTVSMVAIPALIPPQSPQTESCQ